MRYSTTGGVQHPTQETEVFLGQIGKRVTMETITGLLLFK